MGGQMSQDERALLENWVRVSPKDVLSPAIRVLLREHKQMQEQLRKLQRERDRAVYRLKGLRELAGKGRL